MDNVVKPPVGLMPRSIWVGKRIKDIQAAIARYAKADLTVPDEWFLELSELIKLSKRLK